MMCAWSEAKVSGDSFLGKKLTSHNSSVVGTYKWASTPESRSCLFYSIF